LVVRDLEKILLQLQKSVIVVREHSTSDAIRKVLIGLNNHAETRHQPREMARMGAESSWRFFTTGCSFIQAWDDFSVTAHSSA
jgi:hypothetical protein